MKVHKISLDFPPPVMWEERKNDGSRIRFVLRKNQRTFNSEVTSHVIGTCGECEHWLEDKIPKAEGWGQCLSKDMRRISGNFKPPVEHGCIHWEKKDNVPRETTGNS